MHLVLTSFPFEPHLNIYIETYSEHQNLFQLLAIKHSRGQNYLQHSENSLKLRYKYKVMSILKPCKGL